MRDQGQFELAGQHQRFEQLVFARVAAEVRGDHAGLQHNAGANAVDAQVVADGVESLDASSHQRANQILGHAGQAEATEHDGGAIGNIGDRGVAAGKNFVHAGTGSLTVAAHTLELNPREQIAACAEQRSRDDGEHQQVERNAEVRDADQCAPKSVHSIR